MTELEGYYCGLCGRLMPISHFPHSAKEKRVATMTQHFLDTPAAMQVAINKCLATLDTDIYGETVKRVGSHLIVGVSGPGSDTVTDYITLEFSQEQECYHIVSQEQDA